MVTSQQVLEVVINITACLHTSLHDNNLSFYFVARFQFSHSSSTVRMQLCWLFSSMTSTPTCGIYHFLWLAICLSLPAELLLAVLNVLLHGHPTMFPLFPVFAKYWMEEFAGGLQIANCAINCRWHACTDSVFKYVRTTNTCCSTVHRSTMLGNKNHYPVCHKAFVLRAEAGEGVPQDVACRHYDSHTPGYVRSKFY